MLDAVLSVIVNGPMNFGRSFLELPDFSGRFVVESITLSSTGRSKYCGFWM